MYSTTVIRFPSSTTRSERYNSPGSGLSISTEGLKAKEVAPPTLIDVFLNIVPINPIEALSKGNMLQIIFFALLFGFGLSVIGDKGKQVLHFFDGAADVMIKVTGFVMLYAPIGVFGLMAYTVSMHGLSVLLPLIKLVLVMYLACILQILIVYLPCVKVTGLTPSRFLKGLASPMMIAFTTCSSAAALSTTLLSVQKLGASRGVVNVRTVSDVAAALAAPKAPDLPPDYLALDPELPRWKERLGL